MQKKIPMRQCVGCREMRPKRELVRVTIDPEAVDPDDVEMLQDMVVAAANEALRKADAEQAANGWRRQPGLTAGGSSKPRTTANKLSPRRAKLALNVRIGRSCRAHNHHKFSHRILQPHTKRRASHAD